MNFEHWLTQIGKSPRTANSYAGAISGSISNWAKAGGLIPGTLEDIESPKQLQEVMQRIRNLQIYEENNTRGKGMYAAALKQYAAYIADTTSEDIQEDIENILDDSALEATQKKALVNARVGQGKYRKQLIEQWQGCALTGYRDTRFLIASHIKPWKASDNRERLDPFNGLLLLPNLDKIFDLGFITFTENGKITVSEQLEEVGKLGVTSDMEIALDGSHREYMAYHREIVFERNA